MNYIIFKKKGKKKLKKTVLMAMAIMMMATSAFAATPQNTSYDFFVNVENVQDWRQSNYDPEVNVPKVTALEARNGGYDENNVPAKNMTEEEWELLFRGNN